MSIQGYTAANITVDENGNINQASNSGALTGVTTDASFTGSGIPSSQLSLVPQSTTGTYFNTSLTLDPLGSGLITSASSQSNIIGVRQLVYATYPTATAFVDTPTTITGWTGGNNNSNWSNTTGIFTVPTTGYYFFSSQFYFINVTVGDWAGLSISPSHISAMVYSTSVTVALPVWCFGCAYLTSGTQVGVQVSSSVVTVIASVANTNTNWLNIWQLQ